MRLFFFFSLVLCICSCSGKSDGSVTIINVDGSSVAVSSMDKLNSNTVTIPLSKLVEDCSLVQLEINEDALFNPWFTTVTDNHIGVRPRSNTYKLFDRSGKFLRSVGSIGNGPGEYTMSLYDDIIDEKNELIYLAPYMDNKILVYKISGEFVKNIDMPEFIFKPKISLNDNVMTVLHEPHENSKTMFIQFDVNTGEILHELAPPAHLVVDYGDNDIFNTRNVPMTFDFSYICSDTLYHFNLKNKVIRPFFTMTDHLSKKPCKQYFQLNKDLLITRMLGEDLTIATDLKNKSSSYFNIVNDYFGNISIPVYVTKFRNGYFVHNIQPEDLMEDIEKRLSENSCTENDKQTLKKVLSSLEEGANNVVFIGKLKSEINEKLW